ncbi:hypothetical protein BT96DRAFT_940200 [Gymnopus androsaceus JB14]|uniref:Uncharacterized protein n=1 Tax=Gymnopus androsaceus JB14 TaxID=1447944 RepID=A0A6A4HM02_9AGAR|nr:hypothetical protein BT96DRAFT_940200 [Gymnopus androsaceus JB14]
MDPDEWDERTSEIAKELEAEMGLVEDSAMTSETVKELEAKMGLLWTNIDLPINDEEEEVEMEEEHTSEQKLLAAWIASNYSGTTTQDYQIFRYTVHGTPTKTHGRKRVKKLSVNHCRRGVERSIMPICLRVEDIRFNREGVETAYQGDVDDDLEPSTVRERMLIPNTWVIIKYGPYRGDFGIIVQDDYGETELFRPRPIASSRTRPPKAPIPVDFNFSPPIAWQSFIASEQVTVSCIEKGCTDAWNCDHEEHWMKRYVLFNQTIRGGFVLMKVKLYDLDVALQVPDDELAVFEMIADGDPLGNVPPPTSWTFQEKETVILTRNSNVPAALPDTQRNSELGNLPDGTEGVIEKVCNLVCEVAFLYQGQGLGIWSVAQRNLVKKLASGQTVRVAPGIRPFKERRWIQTGDWGVYTMKETQLEFANRMGLVTSVFMHPLHGPSVSVWIQDLSIIVTLNPNSLVDITLEQSLSSSISSHPFSIRDKSLVPSDITICDIRDISVIQRTQSLREDKAKNLEILNPEEYFARQGSRKSGRLPWLGVRVFVSQEERQDRVGWTGQVKEVVPDVEDRSKFFVLIEWNKSSIDSGPFFDWCPYEIVRRSDNLGLLHEFTPYTGNSPWKGFRVKVIKKGVYKDREAWVLDSRTDPVLDRDTVSGMSVHLYFEDGMMVQENRTAWIDYDSIHRSDIKPMRFLHESALTGKGSKSYYIFKLGYKPTYTPQEIKAFQRPAIAFQTSQTSAMLHPEPNNEVILPMPPSPYFNFVAPWESGAPAPEVSETFWLLDCRIWDTLGNREIDVARADQMGDLRLSVQHLGSGAISLQSHVTRVGGSKHDHDFSIIHPGIISRTPWSRNIKRSTTASGLFIICDLEPHVGKLARRVRVNTWDNEKEDRWLLQFVSWRQAAMGMDHTETIADRQITTTKDHFVLVHENISTLNRANAMMCPLRTKEWAPTNGYKVVNGQVVNLKPNSKLKKP